MESSAFKYHLLGVALHHLLSPQCNMKYIFIWLVVSTHFENTSQIGSFRVTKSILWLWFWDRLFNNFGTKIQCGIFFRPYDKLKQTRTQVYETTPVARMVPFGWLSIPVVSQTLNESMVMLRQNNLRSFEICSLFFNPLPKKKNSSHCAPHICKGRSMPNPCSLLAPAFLQG